jgi:uncharacterized protein (DUF433 family)
MSRLKTPGNEHKTEKEPTCLPSQLSLCYRSFSEREMSAKVTYKYLEARPHRWRRQLWIRGRHITVWQLIGAMRAGGYTKEQAAENYDLPVEAVEEAMAYYNENRGLIEAEVEEEGRRLREAGLLPK